jgi:hypothetical protein
VTHKLSGLCIEIKKSFFGAKILDSEDNPTGQLLFKPYTILYIDDKNIKNALVDCDNN